MSAAAKAIAGAVEEQRRTLWDAQAIIESVAQALERQFGDWPAELPMYPWALRRAAKLIDTATGALEAEALESRSRDIAKGAEPGEDSP